MALDNELAPADFDRFSANEGLRQTMDPLGDTSTEREWDRDTGTFNLYGKALTKEQIAASKFGSQYLDLVEKENKGDMGFWEAATPGFMGGTQSVAQYLPFVNNLDTLQTTFANMDAIPNTLRRIQAGEQVSDDERVQFATYMLAQDRLDRASWVAKAGNIVPMSVGFGLEFLAATALAKKTKGASLVALAGKAGTEIAEAASVKAAKEVITKSVRATIGQQYSRFVKKALSRSVYKTAAEASEAMADDLVPKVLSAGSSASMSGVTDIMHSGIASAFTAGSKKALMAGLEGEAVEAAGKAAAKRFAAGALEDQVAWAMKTPGVGSRMARGARLHLMNALTFNREAGEMVDPLLRDRVTKALGFWAMEMPVYGAYQKGLDLVADAGLRAGATALGAETSGFDVGSMQNKVTGYFNNDQEMVDHAVALSIASSYIDYSTEFFGVGFDEITPALFSAIAKPTGKAIGRFATKMAKGEQHYIMGKYFKAAFEMASGTLGEARNRISSIDEGFKAATGTSFGVKDIFNAEKTGALAGQMSNGIETRGSLVAGLGYLIAKKAVEKGITPESAMRVLKTMGYDGVVGEMAEERASSFFSGLTGVNDGSAATEGWGGLSFAKGLQAVKDDLSGDQLYSEALAFSLPMVGVSILSHAQAQLGGGVLAKARALGQNAAQMQDAMNSAVVTLGSDGKAVIHGNVDKTSPNAADALTTDATPGQIIQTNLNSMGDTVLGFFTENLDFSRGHTQGSMAAKIADSALSFVKFLITANPAMMQRNPIMAEIAGMDETTAWVLGDVSKGVLKNKENAEAAFLARQTAKVTATGETAVVGDMATDAEYLADIKRINEEGRDAFKRGLLKVIANKGAVIFDREEQLDTARRIFPGQTANGYNAEKTGDEWSYTLPNVEGKLTDDQLLSKFSSVLDLATSEKMFRSENAMGYSAVATTFLDAARYQVPNENSVLTPVWLDTMASAASRAGTSMRVDFTKGFRADLRSLSNDPNGKDLSANASEYAILSDAQKVGTPAYRQALETLVQRDYGIAPSALSSPGAMQWAEDNIVRQAKILNTIITDRKTVSTLDANGKRITVGELQLDSATGTYSSYTLDKDTGAQVTVATGVAKDAALKALADTVGTGPTDNMVVSGSRIVASPIESLVFYAGQISGTVFAHYVGHYTGVFNANDPAHQDMSWEQKADAMAAEQAEYLASKKLAGIEQHEPKAYPDAKSQEVLVSAGLTKEQAEKFAAYSNFLVDVLQVARGEKFTVSFSNDGVPIIRGLASNTNNSKGEITLSPYSLMPGQIAGTHTGLAEDTIEVWMRRFPGVWTNPQARYVLEAHLTSVAQVLRGLAEDLSKGQAAGAPSGAADKLTTLADKCDPQSPTFARNEVLSHVFNSSMLGHEYGDNLFSGLSAKFTVGEETINVADILRKQSSFAGFADVFVNLVSRATEANNVNYGSVAGTGTRIAAVLADRQSRTRQTLDLMAVDSAFIDQKLTDSVKLSVASATANPIPAYVPRAARIEPAADTPETPTGGAQASAFNPAGGRERMVWDLTGYLYRAVSTGSTAGVVGKVADAWNRVKSQYDYNTDEGQRAFGAIAYDEFRNSRSGVGYSDAERDSYLATLEHRRKQSSTNGGDVHLDNEDAESVESSGSQNLSAWNDNNGDKHALTMQTFMFIAGSLGIESEGSSSSFHEDPVQMIQYVLNGLVDYTWAQADKGNKEPHAYIPIIKSAFTPRHMATPVDFYSSREALATLVDALRRTALEFNDTPGFSERAKVLDALASYLLSVPRKDANVFINTMTSVTSLNGMSIRVNPVAEKEKAGSNGISIQSSSDPLGGDGLDTVSAHAANFDAENGPGLLGKVKKAKGALFDVLGSLGNAIWGLTGVELGAGARSDVHSGARAMWNNPNNPIFGEYAPVTDASGKVTYKPNSRGMKARAAVERLEKLEGPVALGALSNEALWTDAFREKSEATQAAMAFSAEVIELAVGPNPTSALLRDPASVRRIARVWSAAKIVKVFVQSYETSGGAANMISMVDPRTSAKVSVKASYPGDLIKDVVNVYEAVRIAIANAPQPDLLTPMQKAVLAKNVLLARETTANNKDATPSHTVTNMSVANLRTVDTTVQQVFSIVRRGAVPSATSSLPDTTTKETSQRVNALGAMPSAVISTILTDPQVLSIVKEMARYTATSARDEAILIDDFMRFGRYPGTSVTVMNTFTGLESVSVKGHIVSQYKSARFEEVTTRLEMLSDPKGKSFDGFVYFPVYTGDKSSRYIVAIPAMYYDKFAPEAKTYAQRHAAMGSCLAGVYDEKRVAVLTTNTGTPVNHPQGATLCIMALRGEDNQYRLVEAAHGSIYASKNLGEMLGNPVEGSDEQSTETPVTQVKAHISAATPRAELGAAASNVTMWKGHINISRPVDGTPAGDYLPEIGEFVDALAEETHTVAYATDGDAAKASPLLNLSVVNEDGTQTRLIEFLANGGSMEAPLTLRRSDTAGAKGIQVQVNDGTLSLSDLVPGVRLTRSFTLGGIPAIAVMTTFEGNAFDMRKAADINKSSKVVAVDASKNGLTDSGVNAAVNASTEGNIPTGSYDHAAVSGKITLEGIRQLSAEIAATLKQFTTTIRGNAAFIQTAAEALAERDPDSARLLLNGGLSMKDPMVDKALFEYIAATTKSFVPNTAGIRAALFSSGAKVLVDSKTSVTGLGANPAHVQDRLRLSSDGTRAALDGSEDNAYMHPAYVLSTAEGKLAGAADGTRMVSAGSCRANAEGRGAWYDQVVKTIRGAGTGGLFAADRHDIAFRVLSLLSRQSAGRGFLENPTASNPTRDERFAVDYASLLGRFTTRYNGLSEMTAGTSLSNLLTGYGIAHIAEFASAYEQAAEAERPALLAKYFDYTYFRMSNGELILKGVRTQHMRTPSGTPRAHQFLHLGSPVDYRVADGIETRKVFRAINASNFNKVLGDLIPNGRKGEGVVSVLSSLGNPLNGTDIATVRMALKACGVRLVDFTTSAKGTEVYAFVSEVIPKGTLLPGGEAKVMRDAVSRWIAGDDNDGDETVITFGSSTSYGLLHRLTVDRTMPTGAVTLDEEGMGIKVSDKALKFLGEAMWWQDYEAFRSQPLSRLPGYEVKDTEAAYDLVMTGYATMPTGPTTLFPGVKGAEAATAVAGNPTAVARSVDEAKDAGNGRAVAVISTSKYQAAFSLGLEQVPMAQVKGDNVTPLPYLRDPATGEQYTYDVKVAGRTYTVTPMENSGIDKSVSPALARANHEFASFYAANFCNTLFDSMKGKYPVKMRLLQDNLAVFYDLLYNIKWMNAGILNPDRGSAEYRAAYYEGMAKLIGFQQAFIDWYSAVEPGWLKTKAYYEARGAAVPSFNRYVTQVSDIRNREKLEALGLWPKEKFGAGVGRGVSMLLNSYSPLAQEFLDGVRTPLVFGTSPEKLFNQNRAAVDREFATLIGEGPDGPKEVPVASNRYGTAALGSQLRGASSITKTSVQEMTAGYSIYAIVKAKEALGKQIQGLKARVAAGTASKEDVMLNANLNNPDSRIRDEERVAVSYSAAQAAAVLNDMSPECQAFVKTHSVKMPLSQLIGRVLFTATMADQAFATTMKRMPNAFLAFLTEKANGRITFRGAPGLTLLDYADVIREGFAELHRGSGFNAIDGQATSALRNPGTIGYFLQFAPTLVEGFKKDSRAWKAMMTPGMFAGNEQAALDTLALTSKDVASLVMLYAATNLGMVSPRFSTQNFSWAFSDPVHAMLSAARAHVVEGPAATDEWVRIAYGSKASMVGQDNRLLMNDWFRSFAAGERNALDKAQGANELAASDNIRFATKGTVAGYLAGIGVTEGQGAPVPAEDGAYMASDLAIEILDADAKSEVRRLPEAQREAIARIAGLQFASPTFATAMDTISFISYTLGGMSKELNSAILGALNTQRMKPWAQDILDRGHEAQMAEANAEAAETLTDSQAVYNFNERIGAGDAQASAFSPEQPFLNALNHVVGLREKLWDKIQGLDRDTRQRVPDPEGVLPPTDERKQLETAAFDLARKIVAGERAAYDESQALRKARQKVPRVYNQDRFRFAAEGKGLRSGVAGKDPLLLALLPHLVADKTQAAALRAGYKATALEIKAERGGPLGVAREAREAREVHEARGSQASAFSPIDPGQTYQDLLAYVGADSTQLASPSRGKTIRSGADAVKFLEVMFDKSKLNSPADSKVVQARAPSYGAAGPQLLNLLYERMHTSGDPDVTPAKMALVTARLIREHLTALRDIPGGLDKEAGFLQNAADQLQAYGESGVTSTIVIDSERGGVYQKYATLHKTNTLALLKKGVDASKTVNFTMNAHLMSAFYALSAQVRLRDQSTTEWKPVDEAVQAVADYGSYLDKPVIPAAALVADSPESLMPWGLAAEAPEASEDTPAFMTRTRVLPYDVWMAGMMPSAFYGMNLRDLMTDHTAESTLTIARNNLHMINEYLGGAEHGVISLLDYGTDREIAYEKTGVRITDNTGKKTERFARTGLGLRSQSLTDEQRDTVGWLKDTVWSYMLSPSDGGHQITGIDVRFGDILNRDTLEKLGSFNFGTADEADSDGKRHITYALNKALSEAAASLPKEIYTAWVGRAKAALDTAVATNKAIMASRETAKKYNKLSINELFNRVVLAEFRKQGLVAVYTGLEGNVNDTIFAAEYVKAKLSVPTAMSEEAIRTSSWYELLTTKYKREAAKLTIASLSERLSKVYSDAQVKVDANTPWILTADGKKLRGPDGLAPFRVGRGVYRRGNVTIDKVIPDFDATVNRVLEQLKGSLSVDAEGVVTAKGATNRTYALVADLYGIEENSIRAYGQKGRAGVPIADIAGLGVLIQDMHENARAAGRAVPAANTFSDMDLIHAVATRMIHNYYNTATSNQKLDLADIESTLHEIGFNALMKHAGPANISRNEGMREMYEKFNLLPKGGLGAIGALNEWANETETALRWRQAAVVMMMSSDSNGDPILVAEPNLKTPASEDIIPDGVWAALARFWGSKASPEFKYDGNLTGRENAAAAAALYQQLAKVGKNRYARGEVDKYRLVEASGLGSVNRMYARRDVNSDQSCLMNNFTGGEAAGYAEGLMYALGLDNYKSKSIMITKVVKWSRMLNMSMSTFFAWATGVESDIMASGLESFLANFSPAKARKFSKTKAYKFMHAIPVIGGIMGDSITGNRASTRDMMDKVRAADPLMYEARAMAKAMGLISSNMMYDTGSLDGDLKVLTDMINRKFGPGAVKSLEGMRRMLYNAIPEASFEYILEGAKMATITNYMTALKNKAESQGRRFNAKREMARWMPYINSELGGLDLAVYPWLTPGGNELTKQLFMSFQWSMGALEAGGAGVLLKKLTGHAFKPEVQSFMAMRWARTAAVILFGLPALLQVLNKAVGLAGGVDDPTDKWLMWNNELNKRTHANLTPLLRAIAKIPGVKEIKGSENTLVRGVGALIPAYVSEETTGNRKYYMRWGKQAYELSAIFVDFAPVKYTVGKLSGPASAVLEFAVGRNLAMDWEAPFSKMNHLERLYQGNDGRFWTSATWNLIQKSTLPFSVGGLVNAPVANEAGMLVALGPVSKGTNSNAVSDAMIAKFQSWAGQTNVRGKQFRVPFHEIVRQEIKDADANGYDGVALAKKALGRAAQQYYAQIYGNIQGNPSGKRDDEQIYRALVSLSRLNRGADDLSRSLKQRDQQRNIKPDQAMYQARRDTLAPMLRKVKGLPPIELRQAADGGDVSGILGTDEVPEAVLGYQVIKNLSPEDIAFFQQNPKAGGTFSEDPESPEGAGPMPAVTNSAIKEPDSDAVGFLARDEVPETVLGYRIVPEAEFSASDYDYFRKYPKAAGFFDETTAPEAGEPTTPTQPEQPIA